MDELFACRNCVHDAGQSPNLGPGAGYCQFHGSVLEHPSRTTCKYLHRKDLPRFLVAEGVAEHAQEFALYPGPADLATREPVAIVPYSERAAWEDGRYNPLLNALAIDPEIERPRTFIQAFTGGLDGMRSLAHASLVRGYMDRRSRWSKSYRLVLALVQEIDVEPRFEAADLLGVAVDGPENARTQALWDVVFSRIAGLQEYGWHSGLEGLVWVTDTLGEGLADLDWDKLKVDLAAARPKITEAILRHARDNGGFFNTRPERQPEPEGV